jgi:hypothetical protein
VEQEGFDDLGVDVTPRQVDLVGCTDRTMAKRHGKFLLNCNRYITLTASWEADVDSIHCLPGDVVEVAHDVPQWGVFRTRSAGTGEHGDARPAGHPGTGHDIQGPGAALRKQTFWRN